MKQQPEDDDITREFDGPVIEPVRGFGDVSFARADMNYFSAWAGAVRQKRLNEFKTELDKMAGMNPVARAQAMSSAKSANVQIFELLDQQYTPDGITKILKDAYQRAGGDGSKWDQIIQRIGPGRQQQLATDILSEPKPTVQQLRDSLRQLLAKAHRSLAGVETMGDEELIQAAREFQPESESDGDGPLPGSPSEGDRSASSTAEPDTSSAITSTSMIPAA